MYPATWQALVFNSPILCKTYLQGIHERHDCARKICVHVTARGWEDALFCLTTGVLLADFQALRWEHALAIIIVIIAHLH